MLHNSEFNRLTPDEKMFINEFAYEVGKMTAMLEKIRDDNRLLRHVQARGFNLEHASDLLMMLKYLSQTFYKD